MPKRREKRRVDIIGAPVDYGANKRGVAMGPLAFRLSGLLERLEAEGIRAVDLGDVPAKMGPVEDRVREVSEVSRRIARKVSQSLEGGGLPLVLGGDHSVAIGSVAGASRFFRAKKLRLGVIWVDAHGDMNDARTSPSGNIHGMPLAVSLGEGYPELVGLLGFSPKIEAARTVLVGVRNLDGSERERIARFGIHVFTMKDIDQRGIAAVMDEALQITSRSADGVHLSFDMDSVDPEVAPGVGTAVPGGLSYREAHLVMELIHDAGVLRSLDVVETNPFLDVRNATARLGVELILSALGKSIY